MLRWPRSRILDDNVQVFTAFIIIILLFYLYNRRKSGVRSVGVMSDVKKRVKLLKCIKLFSFQTMASKSCDASIRACISCGNWEQKKQTTEERRNEKLRVNSKETDKSCCPQSLSVLYCNIWSSSWWTQGPREKITWHGGYSSWPKSESNNSCLLILLRCVELSPSSTTTPSSNTTINTPPQCLSRWLEIWSWPDWSQWVGWTRTLLSTYCPSQI